MARKPPRLGLRGKARCSPIAVGTEDPAPSEAAEEAKEPFLAALGERAKALRTRRGLTRKALARATGVSERHLANLEYGVGNASILVLLQVAQALQCSLAELVGDVTTQSPEWLLLRELLAGRDEATLRRVRLAALELTGGAPPPINEAPVRSSRIALIGLRGAGKSTLGRMLAEDLDFPFVELSREIEKLAGCSISEILGLYGRTPTAATSAARSRRRLKPIPRRSSPRRAGWSATSSASTSCCATARPSG